MSSVSDHEGISKSGAGSLPGGKRAEDEASGESDGLVLLATFYDPVEAEIVLAKLRSAGIPAYAQHEALSVVWGLTVDGAGRQDIMVRAEDLEAGRAALETRSETEDL